jgi:hypothetical protein
MHPETNRVGVGDALARASMVLFALLALAGRCGCDGS